MQHFIMKVIFIHSEQINAILSKLIGFMESVNTYQLAAEDDPKGKIKIIKHDLLGLLASLGSGFLRTEKQGNNQYAIRI